VVLYSYCIPYDSGAAPNPYWCMCTLVICKPGIRLRAEPGDWVLGLGSAASPIGDISGQVVYAMRITESMPMREYDQLCRHDLRGKIPNWRSRNFQEKVGDCIYDFSDGGDPTMRPGVHDERNRRRDLSGENALLSDHFYYSATILDHCQSICAPLSNRRKDTNPALTPHTWSHSSTGWKASP